VDFPPTPDSVLSAYAKSQIAFKARQLKRTRAFRRESPQDLKQDLTTYLLSRAHLFDPTRGSANTFADRVIRSGIAMMLRDRLRQKRAPELSNISLEQTSPGSDEDAGSLRDALTEADLRRRHGDASDPERAELIDAVHEILQSLPVEDQQICMLRMAGSNVSVARELGITPRDVHDALDRLRKRFEVGGFGKS